LRIATIILGTGEPGSGEERFHRVVEPGYWEELKSYPVARKALGVVLGLPKGNRKLLEELQEPSVWEFPELATEKLISRKLFYQTNLSITQGRICQVKHT
jgi:hypothetical protein